MLEKIKSPGKEYRPVPFWSWNEKLEPEETVRQIRMMHDAGMGGFFMHARGGLQTEYMGKEWFENVAACVAEGKKCGMEVWAYDENGWPSGFGSGRINGKGLAYQQKYLRMQEGEQTGEHTICNCGGRHFYYEVNPFYVDTLDGMVIAAFLDEIYQPYYDKYQNEIEGFFTDEPQISRNGIPWSFIMPEEYEKAYGENLLEHLAELFLPEGDYQKTRLQFWKLVTDLFSKNFMKQIYDWCDARGLKFTGHLVLEESLASQLTSNGAAMPHYEYLHIPGMDWLGRNIYPCLTQLQLSSVAHQLSKKHILTETFALCGHNVGMDELKGNFEWQAVQGITRLCQHLQGYSLRGIRKRDYPPAMYYQQPWWEDYRYFVDAMSRTGMLLSDGEVHFDTLLIHPQSTAWTLFDGNEATLDDLHAKLMNVVGTLQQKHILFHLGDETIMERHARVEGNTLVIGSQTYKTVILPPHEVLFENTKRLLREFEQNGGVIASAEQLAPNPVVDNPALLYTKRSYPDFDLHYFVNSSKKTETANIAQGAKRLDIATGDLEPFYGSHTFGAYESLFVIDDGETRQQQPAKASLAPVDLTGSFAVKNQSLNTVTLDYCDYYFDDVLVEKNGYVLNIQKRACDLKRPVRIRCEYTVQAALLPKELYLVCETPGIFEITVNGSPAGEACGYFVDKSFQKIDIAALIQTGENKIVMTTDFRQSPQVYENLRKSEIFESEKNKLTYDMEIEAIYLAGSFCVKTEGEFVPLERNAVRYKGGFVLAEPKTALLLANLEQQGYPFFAGKITLTKKLHIQDVHACLSFRKKGINVVKVRVNGGKEHIVMWEPFAVDLSDELKPGENELEITLVNNLRNLLGPHHLKEGESYDVGPHSFFKEPCIWHKNPAPGWEEEGYCFCEMSLY